MTNCINLLFQGTMAILMLIPNDFDTLIQYYSFATASYYLATCVALLWFRYKRPNAQRPVKVSYKSRNTSLAQQSF